MKHSYKREECGGADVTFYLSKLLHSRGYSFTTTAETDIVRKIMVQNFTASLLFLIVFYPFTLSLSFSLIFSLARIRLHSFL